MSWVAHSAKTLAKVAEQLGKKEDVKELTKEYKSLVHDLIKIHWNPQSKSFCDLTVDEKG